MSNDLKSVSFVDSTLRHRWEVNKADFDNYISQRRRRSCEKQCCHLSKPKQQGQDLPDMESPVVNTLVYHHLGKVSPGLCHEFTVHHKCSTSAKAINLEGLVKMFITQHLQEAVVYNHLLKVAPDLAMEFSKNHPFFPTSTSLQDLLVRYNEKEEKSIVASYNNNRLKFSSGNIEVVTLSEEEVVDVISSSEYSASQSDTDSDEDKSSENIEVITLSEEEAVEVMSINGHSSKNDFDLDKITDSNKNKQISNVQNDKNQNKNNNKVEPLKLSESMLQAMKELHFISECPDCNNLRNDLKEDSEVDRVVLHILNKDLKITRLNRDYRILSLGRVYRNNHKVPRGIKLGDLSVVEIDTILANWNTLVEETKLENPKEVFGMFCERPLKQQQLKANVLGLYLCQGMLNLRLASDVFHHSEDKILDFVTGKITQTEHDFIMDYISKNAEETGDVFKDIAQLLNRRWPQVLRKYYVKQKDALFKTGPYTMSENKTIIQEVVSKSNIKSVLDVKNIHDKESTVTKETMTSIAKQLGRPVENVSLHWERKLRTILLQFHAGTLNFDVRPCFVDYLVEKNVSNARDIIWTELLSYPQFAGHNKYSLMVIYQVLLSSTQKFYKCKRKEVTASQIAVATREILDPHKAKPPDTRALHKLELAEFYKCLIETKQS